MSDQSYRAVTQALRAIKIIFHPKYEPEVAALPQLVQEGNIALDIGANYGQYSRLLSPLVGTQGHVYAFEPAELTRRGLKLTLRWLRIKNVTPVGIALCDKSGESTLHTPIKDSGRYGVALAHLGENSTRQTVRETVVTDTLDQFVARENLKHVDFIKCDVEGAEGLVLQGGQTVLSQFHPHILAEVDPEYLARHGHSPDTLINLLKPLGYRIFHWKDRKLLEIQDISKSGNYFFLSELRKS